jgi:hypothetical protein
LRVTTHPEVESETGETHSDSSLTC